MDKMGRIWSHPRPDDGPGTGRVAETIHLCCYFAGMVSERDKGSMQLVGTSVAADFPDHLVVEHCIASDPSKPLPADDPADIVFLRKEARV